jgi:hypothetical protein
MSLVSLSLALASTPVRPGRQADVEASDYPLGFLDFGDPIIE